MSWQSHARCVAEGIPSDWFFAGPSTPQFAAAQHCCGLCPVRAPCAAAGRDEHGLWGGRVAIVNTRTAEQVIARRPGEAEAQRRRRATESPERREHRLEAMRLARQRRRRSA